MVDTVYTVISTVTKFIGNPFRSVFNAAATISGVVSLITLFVPITKEFFISNPLWGWGLFFCALVLLPVFAEFAIRERVASANASLEEKHRRAKQSLQEELDTLNTEHRGKDIGLLRDRVGDLNQGSKFFTYLVNGVNHEHLAFWFSSKLQEKVEEWSRDSREIKEPAISQAWSEFVTAAELYEKRMTKYMHEKERRPDALEVPPEWERDDPELYKSAFLELQEAREALELRLRNIHRVIHSG